MLPQGEQRWKKEDRLRSPSLPAGWDTAAWEVAPGLVVPAVLGTLAYLLISTVGRFFGRYEKLRQPQPCRSPATTSVAHRDGPCDCHAVAPSHLSGAVKTAGDLDRRERRLQQLPDRRKCLHRGQVAAVGGILLSQQHPRSSLAAGWLRHQ